MSIRLFILLTQILQNFHFYNKSDIIQTLTHSVELSYAILSWFCAFSLRGCRGPFRSSPLFVNDLKSNWRTDSRKRYHCDRAFKSTDMHLDFLAHLVIWGSLTWPWPCRSSLILTVTNHLTWLHRKITMVSEMVSIPDVCSATIFFFLAELRTKKKHELCVMDLTSEVTSWPDWGLKFEYQSLRLVPAKL